MGITDFLPEFNDFMREVDLRDYAGQKAGIDASIWIYRFVMTSGPAQAVPRFLEFLSILIAAGIHPVVVLDGLHPGSKDAICHERRERLRRRYPQNSRQKNSKQIKSTNFNVRQFFTEKLKQELKIKGIDYIQAPYEADAELTKLYNLGIIHIVITEDSDLIVYGVAIILYRIAGFKACLFDHDIFEKAWKAKFDADLLQKVVILRGCDYLKKGLVRFGINTARRLYQYLIKSYQNDDTIFDWIKTNTSIKIPDGFKESFYEALNTFRYQLVYNPNSKQTVPLSDYPVGKSAVDYPYAGIQSDAEALGDKFFSNVPLQLGSIDDQPVVNLLCMNCDYKSDTEASLKKHIQSVHPFECKDCGRRFKTRYSLKYHNAAIHQTLRPHQCCVCNKSYANKFALTRHVLQKHERERPKCSVCSKTLANNNALKNHVLVIHEKPSFLQCGICKKNCESLKSLKAHVSKYHYGINTFKCVQCPRIFKAKCKLQKHIDSIHEKKKPFECELCDMGFIDAHQLKKHRSAVHEKIKPFKCDVCEKAFSDKSKLKEHRSAVHEKIKSFKCDVCNRSFSTKGKLKRHTILVHITCVVCKKQFKNAKLLDIHIIKVHENKIPLQCNICKRCFSQEDKLKVHISTVHDNKQTFKCSVCTKTFTRKHNLTDHFARMHDDSRTSRWPDVKCKCGICHRTSSNKSNLKRHFKTMHKDIVFNDSYMILNDINK